VLTNVKAVVSKKKGIKMETYYKAVNWNAIEDVVDKATWEKLTEQFWLDTRIPLSNDLDDWRKLSQKEKDLVGKVFGGLTLLDTMQSEIGVSAIKPDVRTPHEEAVLNNIEFMECYTKDHQLLTIDRGWIPINLIKESDIVLAYDKETETTRFEKVLKTSKHLAPHIEHIYNSNIDLRVSPGHRMLFEETSIKSGRITEAWKSYKKNVITAEEFVKLPQTAYYRVPLVRPYINPNKIKRLSTFEKLLIAFQADGSITEREIKRIEQYRNKDPRLKTDTFSIRFTFSKEKKIDKLLNLCKKLNISYKEIKTSFDRIKPRRNFNVFIPFKLLGSFDMKPKLFNNWFSISEFNESKAKQFIEELALWDSHIHQNNDGSRGYISYYTKEQENANFVKAITTLAGYIHNSGVNKDNRSESYSDIYFVRILSSEKQKNIQLQSLYFEKLKGEEVYGVEVPSQFLVVSAGNRTIISGNCVHAKSYSSIFSTLNTKAEIEEIFEWTANNEHLQKKAEIIKDVYDNGTPLQKKVASVFLESFLFYSGFFTPLWYLGNNKLPNVAEIIKLIIRDESVHGTYIGYKFQLAFNELPENEQEELKEWMYDLLYTLYKNEERYTEELYDKIGWTEEVKTFLRYNANKALMNLGQDPLFPEGAEDVNPIIMNGISTGTSNHDFFSQVGNGYLLGEVEAMEDDDYNYGKDI
jgi:ribonucleotide reductase, beta subunit